MTIIKSTKEDGKFVTLVSTHPTEDVIVKSSVEYIPQFLTDVYGKTSRVTKDVTIAKLFRLMRTEYPEYELVNIGTPVNFDVAPTHLTRVVMNFENKDQVEACLKEIAVSDQLIRSRVQPAWNWVMPVLKGLSVMLHVEWYDRVYFLQFKDVFLGDLHCRYSAKFQFDPRDAEITHFRYDDNGNLEEFDELTEEECYADSIKDEVEFLRVFRDGTTETT